MSWKMAPRKSPYRSKFSRKVGSGTSGGEKSRSEAMAQGTTARGLLRFTALQNQVLKERAKVRFLHVISAWSHGAHAHTTCTHTQEQEATVTLESNWRKYAHTFHFVSVCCLLNIKLIKINKQMQKSPTDAFIKTCISLYFVLFCI